MKYIDTIDLKKIIEWRNYIHQNPELSFEEYNTSQYIFDILTKIENLEVSRPTKTSVIGVFDTKKPGKTIALRADIDALPMQEEREDISYKSKIDGRMHSCGHDVHTAMLLGAAHVISKMVADDALTGKIKLIFQHAEELLPGGAKDIVAAGVIDDIDEIFGLHIAGGTPVGLVATRIGGITASTDTFEITLQGIGSHGSTPEKSIDLVSVGAQIVNSLQTIVSRNIAAIDQAVVTVGQFNIGTAPNIIADSGFLSGTVRTFKPETRELIKERIEKTVKGLCEINNATYDLNYIWGYSSINNSKEQFEITKEAASKIEGLTFVELDPQMGGEDFSAYTEKKPGSFTMLGGGGEFYNHHPRFFIEEEALGLGAKLHIQIIQDILGKESR